MLIEVKILSKLFVFYWLIKLNTLVISFCSEEIINALQLTESMGFMMNAKGDTI